MAHLTDVVINKSFLKSYYSAVWSEFKALLADDLPIQWAVWVIELENLIGIVVNESFRLVLWTGSAV